MSQEHKYLRGAVNEVLMEVRGNTVIEKGDFIVCGAVAGGVTSSGAKLTAADYKAYPFKDVAMTTPYYLINNFIGIAMKGSPSGVTEKIPVATDGIWRMALLATAGVSFSNIISATTSAAGILANQTVLHNSLPEGGVTGMALGFCVKTDAAATMVDFRLVSRLSGVSYYDMTRS